MYIRIGSLGGVSNEWLQFKYQQELDIQVIKPCFTTVSYSLNRQFSKLKTVNSERKKSKAFHKYQNNFLQLFSSTVLIQY